MKPVLSKADFATRYREGEFGNASPTWEVVKWVFEVHFGKQLYHLRNRVVQGKTFYNLTTHQLRMKLDKIPSKQWDDWYISEMAPTEHTLIQGEVWRPSATSDEVRSCYLRYNDSIRKPMRDALREGEKHLWDLAAWELLRAYMCARSFDWLIYLTNEYPDHCVEFSTYGVDWGTVPGMNTVFWEVRMY